MPMQKHKYSRQRESILENLKNRTDHPTADMVYSDIRAIFPNVSLGTVYRNLSLLADEDVIQKLVTDNGVLHFDYNTHPHDHFCCRKCGCMIDLHILDTSEICSGVAENFEGTIEKCEVTFYGLCKDCKTTH